MSVTDEIRKPISGRLKERGLNMAEVSRRLGRDETYLQQFLKKGSPKKLSEDDREVLAEVLGISPDELWPDLPACVKPLKIEELQFRCHSYERALRKIVAEEPNSAAADIAGAALRLFE
jgi:lambda repressor-like predicted transcriptional regulator